MTGSSFTRDFTARSSARSAPLPPVSQTLPTTPGQSYVLSFWLTSVAYKGSTTPNSLAVTWNGTTLFDQSDLGAFAWTNMQFVVSATSASSVLQFGDRDDPGAFGLDDVSVQPVTTSFQSVTQSSNTVNFAWSALPGMVYQVQYTDTLSPPNWINSGSAVTATNNVIAASDNVTSSSQRFYRVILLLQ